jgi:hypothetical protein
MVDMGHTALMPTVLIQDFNSCFFCLPLTNELFLNTHGTGVLPRKTR